MAYSHGSATDYSDLWTKLISFLTTDADLAAADQNWSTEWTALGGTMNGVVLQGPGLAGQDEVLVGLKLVQRPTPDEYEIQMVGMTGLIGSATSFDAHVNVTPYKVRTFVDSGPMDYWFVANGRRFVVVVKISTVFQAMYGGLILPYSLPDQYSYPLFIGGSAGETDQTGLTSWRSTSIYHRHFPNSYYDSPPATHQGSAFLLGPSGDWMRCAALGDLAQVNIGPRRYGDGLSISPTLSTFNFGYDDIRTRMRSAFGGDFLLTPHTLTQQAPSDQMFGILDGTYHVAGFGNSSENIVTVSAVDHLVVQDAFRTGVGEYWALRLE